MRVSILVGQIASGKSTWVAENVGINLNNIISKDKLRKFFSRTINKKYVYDETLEEIIHDITLDYYEGMLYLNTKHIIIDETNMDKITRNPYIQLAKKYGYEIEAIIFPDEGEDTHVERRLKDNHGDTSEETWRAVYRRKKSLYEVPIKEEGFDEVIYYEV